MLLKDIFKAYDLVIFDVPPANPIVDWLAFIPLLEAVVIVAEWGRTPLDLLSEMLRSLRMTKTFVLGVIMNKVEDGSVIEHNNHVARYYSSVVQAMTRVRILSHQAGMWLREHLWQIFSSRHRG